MATHTQVIEKKPRNRRSSNQTAIKTRTDHSTYRRTSNRSNGHYNGANGAGKRQEVSSIETRQSLHGMRVSEEEYWAYYYDLPDVSYEWNNGILEEKPLPDFVRITMYGWLQLLLHCYLEVNPIAKMLFLEMGFRLPMEDKTTARKPDLFIIRNDNPVSLRDTDRSYGGICNMCVESVSDSTQGEVTRDTITKKAEYERVGVQEYFILDPGSEMAFYRLDSSGHYQPIQPDTDGVIHSEVLPGFRFRIRDLHAVPSLDMMAEDPVYQPFVMLKYQAEKKRAEAAEAQVKAEKDRADQYAALLRQMGVEV